MSPVVPNRWRVLLAGLIAALMLVVMPARADEAASRVAIAAWTLIPPDGSQHAVILPARFDEFLPMELSKYALRTTAPIPPLLRGRELTLTVGDFRGLAQLRVNGSDAYLERGSVLDVYRPVHPLVFRIPKSVTTAETLDLELTVEHTWRPSGWMHAAPDLGDAKVASSLAFWIDIFNTSTAGTALATTLLVGMLYAFLGAASRSRRRRTYMLFAASSVLNAIYPAALLGITQIVFGRYDFVVVALALIMAAAAASAFTYAYFQVTPQRRWQIVNLAWLVFCSLAAIAASNPFYAVAVLAPLVSVGTLANVYWQLRLFVHLKRSVPRPKNLYLLALAWPATAFLGIPDFMSWVGISAPIGGVLTADVGMTVIGLMQAAALLRDHLESQRRADTLNEELKSRVVMLEEKQREVELLNDELRRQISARSRQLVDSLVKTETDTGEAPRPQVNTGDVVEKRYRVVRLIGEGGMGAVHEVERLIDGGRFAMKMLSVVNDGVARARFAREAQIVARVKHPNVVALIDFDVAEQGFIYLVMELVEGDTLRGVRKRDIDVPWTLYVLAQVAEGLDAIHAQGIVHRDLKPANVLFSRGQDGRRPLVKITDFGVSSMIADDFLSQAISIMTPPSVDLLPPVSKNFEVSSGLRARAGAEDATRDFNRSPREQVAVPRHPERSEGPPQPAPSAPSGESTRVEPLRPKSSPPSIDPPSKSNTNRSNSQPPENTLTRPGVVFGTPFYMAAELVTGRSSRASDMFSLGVMAFELLTHRRPFEECPLRIAIRGEPLPEPPRLSKVISDIPREVADLVDRMISHDPKKRPTAREVADAFKARVDVSSSQPCPPATMPNR